jgi:predicted nucleotidyltransferase
MVESNPNLAILELITYALGPVCDEVIFVGGCAAGLLLTQERPESIRITEDVDIVAQALAGHDYHLIEKKLHKQGFANDTRSDAPICRWVYQEVTLDLMPSMDGIVGPTNRWYPLAIETATSVVLPAGLQIRLICAPVFIATKLEAFKDRGTSESGQPDYLGSHDLEDIMTVLDRRPELLEECASMPLELKDYLGTEFARLLNDLDFSTTLAGHLPGDAASQARLGQLRETIKAMAALHR